MSSIISPCLFQVIDIFDCFGLPEYVRASWEYAGKIARQGLVHAHDRSESCYAVNSLTSTPILDVDIESWSCQCETYLQYTLYAHVLGVLYAVGSLGWFLNRWTEPALDTILSKKLVQDHLVQERSQGNNEHDHQPANERSSTGRNSLMPYTYHLLMTKTKLNLSGLQTIRGCFGVTDVTDVEIPHAPWDLVV